jgi:hypothetical protein
MTWAEMSQDALRAAQRLLVDGHGRSATSRAYYAAYAALTGELARRRTRFARGWNNPTHDQLFALVQSNLPGSVGRRRRVLYAVYTALAKIEETLAEKSQVEVHFRILDPAVAEELPPDHPAEADATA